MVEGTAFIYSKDYLKYQFGPSHPFKPIREKYTLDLIRQQNIFNGSAKHLQPQPATKDNLLNTHTEEYIDYVERMCQRGEGYLDFGDTPATKGLFEGACSVVGGSIYGARLIMKRKFNHIFNPGGGLHHARADRASGFCVFNDIAIATRVLQQSYDIEKVAIIDIDGHHGDGTQEIFYEEPILTISTHRIGIFPGTGFLDEIGKGKGTGYSVNIPLPKGTFHEAYLYAFKEVVPPLIESYEPEIIINQFGVDGHYQDPLVGLALTTKTYEEISRIIHNLAHKFAKGRLLVVGGGGYNVRNTAKCWTIMFTIISQALSEDMKEKYRGLFNGGFKFKNKRILARVEKTVKRIKKDLFPLHGLGSK